MRTLLVRGLEFGDGECAGCTARVFLDCVYVCRLYRNVLNFSGDSSFSNAKTMRLPACLAAEQEAAALEDAAEIAKIIENGGWVISEKDGDDIRKTLARLSEIRKVKT